MTSYTPNLGLPYPDGTDLVMEGDDAFQGLAEDLDDRLFPGSSVSVGIASSGEAVAGATAVDFPGPASMGDFTVNAGKEVFTYTGAADRFFMVAVAVEIENGAGGGTSSIESTVYLQQNGANIGSSFDEVAATGPTLAVRRVVHNIAMPVQLGPGDTIAATAYASPAGTVGATSLRIYPIGPKL